jgi:hypothetical protein
VPTTDDLVDPASFLDRDELDVSALDDSDKDGEQDSASGETPRG